MGGAMGQSKLLQLLTKMRAEGASDLQIKSTLQQLGLSEEQIEAILKAAERDEDARERGEMVNLIRGELNRSAPQIQKLVEEALKKEIRTIEEKVGAATDKRMGEFAGTVNDKVDSINVAVKRLREENIKLTEGVKSLEIDMDELQSGPPQAKVFLSIGVTLLGVAIILLGVWFALGLVPNATSVGAANIEGFIGGVMVELGVILAGIVLVASGVYLRGKPTHMGAVAK
jgi:DNA-binding transcriptional MerR regulator